MEPHTNADDASRYRDGAEVEAWLARDPIARLETYLRGRGLLDDDAVEAVRTEAEASAADLRTRMNVEPTPAPLSLFDHVYAQPTPQLLEQREQVRAELAAAAEDAAAGEEAGA
jgi:pyruvate dehydrogenase E1 component alpha subunit